MDSSVKSGVQTPEQFKNGTGSRAALIVLLIVMVLAWIPPGLFGHQPWKPDEGYTIGLVNHMVKTGDWVVPTLTGEHFMEKPPIFFATASVLARFLSPDILPLHQAAALATAFYMLLTFLFAFLSGRELGGTFKGIACALGLLGCIGLTVRAHSAITDTALWCGFAVAGYGMVLANRRFVAGAFWFGTGVGLTFMSKGFQGPAFLGVANILLPVFCPDKRTWRYVKFLFLSLAFCLPWLLVWPIALYRRSPELFQVWFFDNNVGRFLGNRYGFRPLAQKGTPWKYVFLFPWFTLPLWPPAILAWWRKGWRGVRDANIMFPTLVVVCGTALLSAAAGRRELYMIPLIPPLAVIAVQYGGALPKWLEALLKRTPVIVAGVGLVLVWAFWFGWRAGWPAMLTHKLDAAAPGLVSGTGTVSLVLAIAYTLVWIWLFVFPRTFRLGWEWAWAGGLTAAWGVSMLLFMPIFDYVNGYRPTFADMVSHLPEDASENVKIYNFRLGESQRAILEYYFGIVTQSAQKKELAKYDDSVVDTHDGKYLLVQFSGGRTYYPDASWQRIWEGARPGDKRERYMLYKRVKEEGQQSE